MLELAAADLAGDAEERAAALIAAAAELGSRARVHDAGESHPAREARSGEAHLALPRAWRPASAEDPATFSLPAPGRWRVDALLPAASCPAPPELLGRLLLAELLDGLAAAVKARRKKGKR